MPQEKVFGAGQMQQFLRAWMQEEANEGLYFGRGNGIPQMDLMTLLQRFTDHATTLADEIGLPRIEPGEGEEAETGSDTSSGSADQAGGSENGATDTPAVNVDEVDADEGDESGIGGLLGEILDILMDVLPGFGGSLDDEAEAAADVVPAAAFQSAPEILEDLLLALTPLPTLSSPGSEFLG